MNGATIPPAFPQKFIQPPTNEGLISPLSLVERRQDERRMGLRKKRVKIIKMRNAFKSLRNDIVTRDAVTTAYERTERRESFFSLSIMKPKSMAPVAITIHGTEPNRDELELVRNLTFRK